jgi:crotonobetaine/carnitine-CoA ligase
MPSENQVPPVDRCVLRYALEKHAAATPDKVFAVFGADDSWTYAETFRRAQATARALRKLGVKQGDHVLVWLPSGRDCLQTWFAINYLGAVYVPINTAYRGGLLEHVVENSDARLGVIHAELAPRLATIDRAKLAQAIVLLGEPPAPIEGLRLLPASALEDDGSDPLELERPIAPWDTQSIIYTSGTTGPSKGVLSSYLHLFAMGEGLPLVTGDDRFLINLPLFHAGGTGSVYWSLTRGGSIALVGAFSTETFWETIRVSGTTTLILLGVMASFLMKRSARDEVLPRLRSILALPLDEDAIAFGRRYDVPLTTVFNMTEVSCPLMSGLNPTIAGLAGRPRPGIDARVVDENDIEVPVGQIGELIVRSDQPWTMNHGYYKNPEATARAWRNGWFHTGDGFKLDAEGNFYFVDRMKDAIRRRGENISSFEVESEVCAHPAVREAAAVAVASEVAEDELLVAVSLADGQTLDPAELVEFLRERVAHFMIPRYVRVMSDLPKTPTSKVQKHLIRTDGVTAETWDRERAGVVIKREKLTTR